MTSSAIAGNEAVLNDVVDLLAEREVVAFVGAGASADLYGAWPDLIEFLVETAHKRAYATKEQVCCWRRYSSRRPQYVVRAIRRAFPDDRVYFGTLRDYFGTRMHPKTGQCYSPLHEAIVMLPLKGLVTTNYDPCLSEALRVCRPNLESAALTWQDSDHVHRWKTGEVFRSRDKPCCPLLHLHGIWNRPETMVLDNDMYRKAYSDTQFLNMLKHLWDAQHLLLIGVGFSDSWLDRMLDEVLASPAPGERPRHVAVLGLRDEDLDSVRELRMLMEYAYNASSLFYPVRKELVAGKPVEDHQGVLHILGMLLHEAEAKRRLG